MRLRIVRNLVAHPGGQPEEAAIRQLGLQLPGDAEENVTLVAPMIRSVAGRVFDQPHSDLPKLLRAPSRHAGLARVLDGIDLLPISDPKRDIAQVQEHRLGESRTRRATRRPIGVGKGESLVGPGAPLPCVDPKHPARPSRRIRPHARSNRADLLDRSLGSKVRRVDEEDHPTDVAERVLEHEAFHLPVIRPTPVRPGQKGPADFDLIGHLIIAVKARRSYHLTGRGFHRKQGSPGVQRLLEEALEARWLTTGLVRVLPPDQGVGSNREERTVVGWRQGAKGHERPFQGRLKIKGHNRNPRRLRPRWSGGHGFVRARWHEQVEADRAPRGELLMGDDARKDHGIRKEYPAARSQDPVPLAKQRDAAGDMAHRIVRDDGVKALVGERKGLAGINYFEVYPLGQSSGVGEGSSGLSAAAYAG